MIEKLRSETRELHQEIEKDNLAGLILTHQIIVEDYKLLLLQNYIAYKVTETQIKKFLPNFKTDKSEQLNADLDDLEVNTTIVEEYMNLFNCNSKAEAIGAAYVVEGSALGGLMISKELKHCEKLSAVENFHFFNGERDGLKSWRAFCKDLKSYNFTPEQEEEVIKKAKETFLFFGHIFKKEQVLRESFLL